MNPGQKSLQTSRTAQCSVRPVGSSRAHLGTAPERSASGARLCRRGQPQHVPPPKGLGCFQRLDGAKPLRLGFAKGRWRINDRVFEMGSFPIAVARSAREVWLFRNYHTSMPHAMHLHGFPMRVVARETSPDFLKALAVDDRGRLPTDLGVKDTVLVWPGETVRAVVDFALRWPERQDYLVHCHNLEHEDGGMMLGVRVG